MINSSNTHFPYPIKTGRILAPNYYLNANCIASYNQRKKIRQISKNALFLPANALGIFESYPLLIIQENYQSKNPKMHIILIYKYVLGLIDSVSLFYQSKIQTKYPKCKYKVIDLFDSISLCNYSTNQTKYP